jgi:hypothetical protein
VVFVKVQCVIDGTEIKIEKPSRPLVHPNNKNHQLTYSSKKKQHSLSVQIICKLNGKIIYFSPAQLMHNNQQQWNDLKLRSKFIDKPYGIIADGGYTLNPKDLPKIIGKIPFKRKNGVLTPSEKAQNTTLAQRHVVVENVNAQLKKWGILWQKFRHFEKRPGKTAWVPIDLVVSLICGLTNRRIKKHPLRPNNWFPSKVVPAVPAAPETFLQRAQNHNKNPIPIKQAQ